MSVISSEIELQGLALLLNTIGWVYIVDVGVCGCLRGWGYSLGPLGEEAMRLPPADVAASPGEGFAHPGRHEHVAQAAP